jgi:hypothetical protein
MTAEQLNDKAYLTLSVLVGNSDNRLTQMEWSSYAGKVNDLVRACTYHTFFNGAPYTASLFQNHCWVFSIHKDDYDKFEGEVREVALHYEQESVAIVKGKTHILKTMCNKTHCPNCAEPVGKSHTFCCNCGLDLSEVDWSDVPV